MGVYLIYIELVEYTLYVGSIKNFRIRKKSHKSVFQYYGGHQNMILQGTHNRLKFNKQNLGLNYDQLIEKYF